jgi:hypothetical protein
MLTRPLNTVRPEPVEGVTTRLRQSQPERNTSDKLGRVNNWFIDNLQ